MTYIKEDEPIELASIKKPDDVELITREEYDRRIKEVARCKRDIVYFANKYFRIISLDKGLMTIKLYPKQEELLQNLVKNDRNIVLASRQTGKCFSGDTYITLRDKKTQKIIKIQAKDLFNAGK